MKTWTTLKTDRSFKVDGLNLEVARGSGRAFQQNDLILPIKDRVWYFDTENDKISVIGFLNIGRMNFRTLRIEQNVYLIGGFGENEIEKYDLETNHSTQLTSKTEFILYPEIVARKYYNC